MKWIKEIENGIFIEIDDDDKYDIIKQFSSQLQNDEFWYIFLVKNVQVIDYINYYCVGINKYGEGKIIIVLFGKYDIIFIVIREQEVFIFDTMQFYGQIFFFME